MVAFLLISHQFIFLHRNRHDRVTKLLRIYHAVTMVCCISSTTWRALSSLRITQCRDRSKKRCKRMKKPTALSSKNPKDRVVEFPNEGLIVNNGELFCTLCDKQLLTKQSILVQHLGSKRHVVDMVNRCLVTMFASL